MSDRTYSISIKGEQHVWGVAAWSKLSFEQLCATLSDVTGYRAEFLKQDLPKHFDRLGYAQQKPSSVCMGDVPTFMIRSSDGGKPS